MTPVSGRVGDPRGCIRCKRRFWPSVLYTVPAGWFRLVSPRTRDVVILCPDCKGRAS